MFLLWIFVCIRSIYWCEAIPEDDVRKEKLHDFITDLLDRHEMEKNLKFFTKKPHLASSKQNDKIIQYIYKQFEAYGFKPTVHPYDILLSTLSERKRNYAYLLDKSNKVLFRSKGFEQPLEKSEFSTQRNSPPYNSYSPNGTVEGELIYANFGTEQDFDTLEEKYGVNVTGKIVIVRYDEGTRGPKIRNAEERGAIGMLLYDDPINAAPVKDTFNKSWWLPKDGVQRGTILGSSFETDTAGDPTTPGYPAKDWSYHLPVSKIKGLPKILVQPISYDDALHLMRSMGGPDVDESWRGKLKMKYRTGPHKDQKVRIEIFNQLEIKTVTNVCGTMEGNVEPDRYVILGNHVDAWVFGGIDPSSGTSIMMEIARVLGYMKKNKGWTPRRTIKICGWDAEEFGTLGSYEYVEEYYNELNNRAIAYINIDAAVAGNETIHFKSSPLLQQMMFEVNKKVKDPFNNSLSVFEKTKEILPDSYNKGFHSIDDLAMTSDYMAFYHVVGVPSVDLTYRQNLTNFLSYPTYHTIHDTFYYVKNFIDRHFTCHLTMGRLVMRYVLNLADNVIIPFDIKRYSQRLHIAVNKTLKVFAERKKKRQFNTAPLVSAVNNFTNYMRDFIDEVANIDTKSPIKVRILNDRLLQIERSFMYLGGLPGRKYYRHYIIAPPLNSKFELGTFPAIVNAFALSKSIEDWDEVDRQLSITTFIIQRAAESLKSLI